MGRRNCWCGERGSEIGTASDQGRGSAGNAENDEKVGAIACGGGDVRSNIVHGDGTCGGGGGVYDVGIEDVGLRERGRIIVGLSKNDSGDDVVESPRRGVNR